MGDGVLGWTGVLRPAPDAAVYAGFEDWYRDVHGTVLATVALWCGSLEAARDATDEAFVRALARWPKVSAMTAPVGWTVRTAMNVAKRRARRAAVERRLLHRERPRPPLPAPAGEVWDVVRHLPPRQRTVIVLRYVSDLPEDEIGRMLGISRSAVSSALTDARRRLAVTLADVTVDATVPSAADGPGAQP